MGREWERHSVRAAAHAEAKEAERKRKEREQQEEISRLKEAIRKFEEAMNNSPPPDDFQKMTITKSAWKAVISTGSREFEAFGNTPEEAGAAVMKLMLSSRRGDGQEG